MNFVLLLGAGFSRNWGGWLASEAFEYLLGCPQVDADLRTLLWSHRNTDGFEGALAELQEEYSTKKDASSHQRMLALQNAIEARKDGRAKMDLRMPPPRLGQESF